MFSCQDFKQIYINFKSCLNILISWNRLNLLNSEIQVNDVFQHVFQLLVVNEIKWLKFCFKIFNIEINKLLVKSRQTVYTDSCVCKTVFDNVKLLLWDRSAKILIVIVVWFLNWFTVVILWIFVLKMIIIFMSCYLCWESEKSLSIKSINWWNVLISCDHICCLNCNFTATYSIIEFCFLMFTTEYLLSIIFNHINHSQSLILKLN